MNTANSIIAFVGFKGSGKNTAAIPLIDQGFKSFSFADGIKDCLASIFCWDRQMLEGITPESRVWREQVDPWWAEKLGIPNFSPRWAMMNFGTQLMREHFNKNIWLYNMERRIMMVGDNPVVMVDGRFANELEMARRYRARIIRIKRGSEPEWMEIARQANAGSDHHQLFLDDLGVHESEYGWIGSPVDATIENDGSISDLHAAILRETHDATMAGRPLRY
jgi:hypothetical protein